MELKPILGRSKTMSIKKETVAGIEIAIEDGKKLTINQKEIDYEHDHENDKWVSKYLPYSEYDSLEELARAIVNDTQEFKQL